jgi:hypothetical protein
MRPLLNGGTLGRLHRVSGFLLVRDRDRDRHVIDDQLKSRREGLLAGGIRGFLRTGRDQAAFNVLPAVRRASSLRHGLENETAPFPPARLIPRLCVRLFNSFFSPVVKYHGLGCATGFGDLRPCYTLHPLLDGARTASSAMDWRDLAERAGLRTRLFKLTTPRLLLFERPPQLARC